MAAVGSAEWVAARAATWASVEVLPGADATVVWRIGSGKASDVCFTDDVRAGVVVASRPGADAVPDLEVTVAPKDAPGLLGGADDWAVAYMQGRLKVAGVPGHVLDLLAAAAAPAHGAARSASV